MPRQETDASHAVIPFSGKPLIDGLHLKGVAVITAMINHGSHGGYGGQNVTLVVGTGVPHKDPPFAKAGRV